MLNVTYASVVTIAFMLSVVMLSVVLLSVVMLSVAMLNVVGPFFNIDNKCQYELFVLIKF
jgi:hypothetical protein